MPLRVVSLLPSATETLCLVGGRDLLVGRSHECDFPSGLDAIPVLTRARTAYDPASDRPSADVDRQVREALQTGSSLYELDAGRLEQLKPDLILTQDLCDVCSIDLATVRRAAASLDPEPEVVALNPETIEGVLDDVLTVGSAIGRGPDASRCVAELNRRLFEAQGYVNAYDEGPSVLWLEWTDPPFVAGHWIVQCIERAGGRHPLNPGVPKPTSGAAAGPMMAERVAGKSVRVDAESIARSQPEAAIVCPCGLTLDEAHRDAHRLLAEPWFRGTPAARAGRVAVVDGHQMFNRPGPRLVDGLEWLVSWLQDRPALAPTGFPWRALRA